MLTCFNSSLSVTLLRCDKWSNAAFWPRNVYIDEYSLIIPCLLAQKIWNLFPLIKGKPNELRVGFGHLILLPCVRKLVKLVSVCVWHWRNTTILPGDNFFLVCLTYFLSTYFKSICFYYYYYYCLFAVPEISTPWFWM